MHSVRFSTSGGAGLGLVLSAAVGLLSAAFSNASGAEVVPDAAVVAAERKVAEKLAAMGAEVTFCESGLVDKVNFTAEDPHSLEPQFSTAQLKEVRPLLDKLSVVGEVSFIMNVGDPAELRQLYGIKRLSSLNLQGGDKMKIEAKHLVGLGDGGSLRNLYISGPNIDDAISAIGEFESLETFTVYTKVDDRRLAELAALPNLHTISLVYQPATDETAEALAKIGALEIVQLGRCEISDAGMKHIAKLERLEAINFSNPSFTETGVAELATCTELTRLAIGGNRITNEALKHIGRLRALEYLDLSGAAITDAGLPALDGLTKLKTLIVMRTQITQRGIDALRAKLPALEQASGLPDYIDPPTHWLLTQKDAEVLWKDGAISVICTDSNRHKLTPGDITAIKGADALQGLSLHDCPFGDDDLRVLLRFKELRGLTLAGTRITDAGLKQLADFPKLEELDLSRTAITDAAIDQLLTFKELQRVEIADTQITIKAAARLRQKMRVRTGLE